MPGCLASLVIALAFGTTKSLRGRLRVAFAPPRSRRRSRRREHDVDVNVSANADPSRSRSRSRRRRRPRSGEFRYVAMDTDNGILSRQKRLSMEKQLRIEVTYEFEIRNEQVAAPVLQLRGQGQGAGGGRRAGASKFPYSVESHRWDDTERILPKKPSVSVMRGQG